MTLGSALSGRPSHVRQPLGRLSKALLVHPTTITVAIDQLEGAGLVRRVPHPSDRRTVLAQLTRAGHDMAERASDSLAPIGFGLHGISGAGSAASPPTCAKSARRSATSADPAPVCAPSTY